MWNSITKHIIETGKGFFKRSDLTLLKEENENINYKNKIKYMRIGEIVSVVVLLALVLYIILIA